MKRNADIKRLQLNKYQFLIQPLRVLSVLRVSIFSLTAERAETAKGSVRAFIPSLIPITLRVLCVLRGFILLTTEPAEIAKDFRNGVQVKTITH